MSNHLSGILLLAGILALGEAAPASTTRKHFTVVNHDEQAYVPGVPWQGKEKQQTGIQHYQMLNKINRFAKQEASGLGDAARYIADAFSKWKSNSNLQPGEFFQILAELLDEKCGPKAGDSFRYLSKILDAMKRDSELLGFSHEGKDVLKDFDIVNFLRTFANALDGLHDGGELQMQDLIEILKTMARKVGGEGIDEVITFIDIAVKLLGTVFNTHGDQQVGKNWGVSHTISKGNGILSPTGQSGIHGQEEDIGKILFCSLGAIFG